MKFRSSFEVATVVLIFTLTRRVVSGDITATCDVKSGSGSDTVSGTIKLTQADNGGPVTININLRDIRAGDHGFHVHNTKSLDNKCMGAGPHLNLENTTHGAPTDPHDKRHTGDLGNINVPTATTNVITTIQDSLISLSGTNNVIGYPIVIHADPDDMGTGGHLDSNTTGHAGARIGCCLITAGAPSTTFATLSLTSLLLVCLSSVILGSAHSD